MGLARRPPALGQRRAGSAAPSAQHRARQRPCHVVAAAPRRPDPPLTSPSAPPPTHRAAFDVAVVGGGALGLLVAAESASQGARTLWVSWEGCEGEGVASLPRFRPSRARLARAAAADPRAVALAADGLAWWEATAPNTLALTGCLDVAGRGEAGDALDAVAAAVAAAGVRGGCARLAAGEVAARVPGARGLALPRGGSGLWLPLGGGVLDARAAGAAASAAATRAGAAVWGGGVRGGGWADAGSHFRLWGWRPGSGGGGGGDAPTTVVAEAERLVLVPRPHAVSDGGGVAVGCPAFGASLPGAGVRWVAWARGTAATATPTPASTSASAALPVIHCGAGLAPPGPDDPPGGAAEAWAALPASPAGGGTPPTILRPPAAALRAPPWPGADAVWADAMAAATAAARALPPTALGLPRPAAGGAGAAAAAGGGWPVLETGDGLPLAGWAPPGGALGREAGRVLLVASAVGGAAGVSDGLAAAPALARAAAALLAGGAAGAAGAAGLEPGRAGVGVEAGPATHADTWAGHA